MNKSHGFIALPALVVAVVFAALLAGGTWWYVEKRDDTAAMPNTNQTVASENANSNVNAVVNGNTNTVVDATAGWQTYTSTKFGFSLKLPPDWENYKVTEGADQVKITHPKTSTVSFVVVRTKTPVDVAQTLGTKDGYTYQMSASNGAVAAGYQTAWDAISKVQATFALVEETASWKTYTNERYGFSFKYPAEYELTNGSLGAIRKKDGNGGMSFSIIDRKLDPNNIIGLYGSIENITKVAIGSQPGYQYREGDAGCGGDAIQTVLAGNKTLLLNVGVCEGGKNVLYTDLKARMAILQTFTFTTGQEWSTYTNSTLRYSFEYPKGNIVTPVAGTDTVLVRTTATAKPWMQVEFRQENEDGTLTTWFDNKPAGDGVLGDMSAKKFAYKYCDGPGCGPETLAYVTQYRGELLGLSFLGDRVLNTQEAMVLQSFTFHPEFIAATLAASGNNVRKQTWGTVAAMGESMLVGGYARSLLSYNGTILQDISTLVQKEQAASIPRIDEVASNGKYWLVSAYGSNYLHLYKYDGKAMIEVTLPGVDPAKESTFPYRMTWMGDRWLMGYGGQLYSYDGTTFSVFKYLNNDQLTVADIGWNGTEGMVLLKSTAQNPTQVYTLYRYKGGELTLDTAPTKGDFSRVMYGGNKWLFAGSKWVDETVQYSVMVKEGTTYNDYSKKLQTIMNRMGNRNVLLSLGWWRDRWFIGMSEGLFFMPQNFSYGERLYPGGRWYEGLAFSNAYGLVVGQNEVAKITEVKLP